MHANLCISFIYSYWASLTQFHFLLVADVTVFAKKEIPLRTKFGPVEGDVMERVNDPEKMKKHSAQPLPQYFIDKSKYIDTSNERKSRSNR